MTWTLLVHTLAIEAAEAGDPASATGVITGDLRRTTILATTISLVLAGVLFVTLPRLKGNLMRGGSGPSLALSGFSDRVTLGTVGRIRKDQSIVLRVQSATDDAPLPPPEQAYWRGLAFDAFDGRDWSISKDERLADRRPVTGVGRFGIVLAPDVEPTSSSIVAQRILREPVEAGVIFTAGEAVRIEGPFQGLERDRNDGIYLPGRGVGRLRYTIWSRPSERDAVRLRLDTATPPLEPAQAAPAQRPALPALPAPTRVHARAAALVAGARTDFERALAIRDALRRDGRYTDAPRSLENAETSAIEAFLLGELEGHCEYFASAMVVLARSAGLPARLVNGFAGGLPNEVGGFIEVSRADAHAWVEIHFADAGWVRPDSAGPAPPGIGRPSPGCGWPTCNRALVVPRASLRQRRPDRRPTGSGRDGAIEPNERVDEPAQPSPSLSNPPGLPTRSLLRCVLLGRGSRLRRSRAVTPGDPRPTAAPSNLQRAASRAAPRPPRGPSPPPLQAAPARGLGRLRPYHHGLPRGALRPTACRRPTSPSDPKARRRWDGSAESGGRRPVPPRPERAGEPLGGDGADAWSA